MDAYKPSERRPDGAYSGRAEVYRSVASMFSADREILDVGCHKTPWEPRHDFSVSVDLVFEGKRVLSGLCIIARHVSNTHTLNASLDQIARSTKALTLCR